MGPQKWKPLFTSEAPEHRAEKWTRFSLTRTSGSARTMLPSKGKASDGSRKCKSTFGSDALGILRRSGAPVHHPRMRAKKPAPTALMAELEAYDQVGLR